MQHFLRFSQQCKYLVFRDVTLHFWETFGSSVRNQWQWCCTTF